MPLTTELPPAEPEWGQFPLPYEMTATPTAEGNCSYCPNSANRRWYHPDEVDDVRTCVNHHRFQRCTQKPLIDQWWARAAYRDGWRP